MKTSCSSNAILSIMDSKPCLIGAIYPIFLLAQAGNETEEGITIGNIVISLVYFILFFLCVGFVIYMIKNGVFSINKEIVAEEEDFENKLLEEFKSETSSSKMEVPSEAHTKQTGEIHPDEKITSSNMSIHDNTSGDATDDSPEALAQRLKKLMVISTFQGNLELPVKPNGLIYTMCRGGSCLILPRQESVEMMNYYCRRYTTVFVPSGEQEVLVYGRLQDQLQGLTGNSKS